jgi:hypothetical protein
MRVAVLHMLLTACEEAELDGCVQAASCFDFDCHLHPTAMRIKAHMETTTRAALERQIKERTERKRREGDQDDFESEHAAICDALDALILEGRGPECNTLLDLVRDKYPNHYSGFKIHYDFKL